MESSSVPSWRRSCLSWRRRGAGRSERKQRLTRRKIFRLGLSSSNYFHLPETAQVWLLERSNSQSPDSTNSATLVRLCATVQLSCDSFQKPGARGQPSIHAAIFYLLLSDLRPLNYRTLRLAIRSAFWEEICSHCMAQLGPTRSPRRPVTACGSRLGDLAAVCSVKRLLVFFSFPRDSTSSIWTQHLLLFFTEETNYTDADQTAGLVPVKEPRTRSWMHVCASMDMYCTCG